MSTLMIVDDNAIDQMMCERVAQRTGVVEAVIAYNYADEALDYLQRNKEPMPDVILLDINMPRMDGFEFLEALCQLPKNIQRPVIVLLTTSLIPKDEARAKQFEPVKGCLTKPLSKETLLNVLGSLV